MVKITSSCLQTYSVAASNLRLINSSNGLVVIPPDGETLEDKAASDSPLAVCDSRQHENLGHCGKFGIKHGSLSLQVWGWVLPVQQQ